MGADTIISQVARAPSNLLDFVNTKALGRNPDELLQAVRPTIGIEQFLLSSATQTMTVTATDALGQTGPSTEATSYVAVPVDRVWVPLNWTGRASAVGAGDIGRLRLVICAPRAGAPVTPVWLSDASGVQATTVPVTSIATATYDFRSGGFLEFFGAGHTFGLWWDQNIVAVGGMLVSWTLTYLELGG